VRNLALTIGYDGTDFNGWQTQPGYRTVQETLEAAIAALTGEPRVHLNASGRTDAGVHAVGQVANFYTAAEYPPEVIVKAVNARLPPDVVVSQAVERLQVFDANKDAKRKLYRYVIHDGPVPSPFLRRYVCNVRHRLDAAAMRRASRCLIGRHDFHSFETDWHNRTSSVRTILDLKVERSGAFVTIEVEADGFLYNMVRSITGTLVWVGTGKRTTQWVADVLKAESRIEAGPTAPPQGLYLIAVRYDS
jgi:tRNA pseudouridine38-40 synthase